MGMRVGEQLLPFVKLFYGDPSTYLPVGDVHHIHQGEGGQQRDALMPMLFCLGQHGALRRGATVLPLERSCSHTWTTCTWCANLTESGTYTPLLGKNSGDTPQSTFTTGRLKCGTVEERALTHAQHWPRQPKCRDVNKIWWSRVLLWVKLNSWRPSWTTSCCREFRWSKISQRHGCCSVSALRRAPISSCALWIQNREKHSPRATMTASSGRV